MSVSWIWNYALARAREPSTWRGLVMLIAGSWAVSHHDQAEAVIALAVALAGAIGAFTADAPLPPPALPPAPPPDPAPGVLRDPPGEGDTGHVRPITGRARDNPEPNPPGPFGF